MPERKLIDKDEALLFKADNGAVYKLNVTNDGGLYFTLQSGASSTDAVAMWKASEYSGSGQILRDLSGNGHHLKFGSSQPAYITNGYLVLPGQAGNNASTPDSTANSITGDIDIRAKIALNDWTPSGDAYIVSKWTGEGYAFRVNGVSGNLTFQYNAAGVDQFRESSTAPTVTDGNPLWVRVTRSSSSGNVTFYTSTDGSIWTQLGSAVSGAAGAMDDSGNSLLIGTLNGSQGELNGKVYFVEMRNGIDGPVAVKFDPSSQLDNATSWTSSTGEVWTVNSTAATDGSDPQYLAYSGSKYLYLPGIDGNCITLTHDDALDITGAIDLRFKLALDDWTPSVEPYLFNNGANGYGVFISTAGRLCITSAATGTSTGAQVLGYADGTTKWLRITRAGTTTHVYDSEDGIVWNSRGTSTIAGGSFGVQNTDHKIGAWANGTNPLAGKLYQVQVFASVDGSNKVLDINFSDTTATSVSSTKYAVTAGMVSATGGIVIQNVNNLINGTTGEQAFHTDSSTPGASLVFNIGTPVAMRKVQIYSSGGSHPGIWRVDYSDDGTNWTNVPEVYFGPWAAIGYKGASWANVGAHTRWRVRLIAATGGAAWMDNVDWFADTGNLDVPRASSGTFTTQKGQIATINRSSSGRKSVVVDRPLFLFGLDDYMEAVDNDQLDVTAGDSLTAVIAFRQQGATANVDKYFLTKKNTGSTNAPGWGLFQRTASPHEGRETISDGTNETNVSSAGGLPSATPVVLALVRNTGNDTIRVYQNGVSGSSTTDTTTGSLANSIAVRVGSLGNGTAFTDMEFIGAAIWKRALTDAEISYLAGEFGAS